MCGKAQRWRPANQQAARPSMLRPGASISATAALLLLAGQGTGTRWPPCLRSQWLQRQPQPPLAVRLPLE